jgi:hypothetical protein
MTSNFIEEIKKLNSKLNFIPKHNIDSKIHKINIYIMMHRIKVFNNLTDQKNIEIWKNSLITTNKT